MTEQERRIDMIRMRAEDAGLVLDEDRLAVLADLWPGVEAMVAAMEQVAIDPLDLGLGTFDAAWNDLERRR